MSDDVTARITEALARRVSCGATGDRYLVGGEARPLLAEARDEITRLRELCGFLIDAAATHRISVPLNSSLLDLAADIAGGPALDAGDALNVGPDTTGEGT